MYLAKGFGIELERLVLRWRISYSGGESRIEVVNLLLRRRSDIGLEGMVLRRRSDIEMEGMVLRQRSDIELQGLK